MTKNSNPSGIQKNTIDFDNVQLNHIQLAEDEAWNAQEEYEKGNHEAGAQYVKRALQLDPLCTHALLQKASRIDDMEERLTLLRLALEGAAREVVSDQKHLIDRLEMYEETAKKQWSISYFQDEEEEENVFNKPAEKRIFYDRWPELSMRDYVRALFSIGEILLRMNRPAEASLHLRELCSQSPSNRFESKVWLCATHIQMKDMSGAASIARTDTSKNVRWGEKVVSLCELATEEISPEEFASRHPLFVKCLGHYALMPAPGPDLARNNNGRGYQIHELEAALTPEWARALACPVRIQPKLLKAVTKAAQSFK